MTAGTVRSHRKCSNYLSGQKLEKTVHNGKFFLITRELKLYGNIYFFVTYSRDFQAHARRLQNLNSQVYQLSTLRFENKIAKIWIEWTMDFVPYLHIFALWIGRETRGAHRSRTKNMSVAVFIPSLIYSSAWHKEQRDHTHKSELTKRSGMSFPDFFFLCFLDLKFKLSVYRPVSNVLPNTANHKMKVQFKV